MAKNSVAGLLTSVDELFSTQESRDEAKLERVINLPPGEISDFPNHPFKVRMDEEMQQMAESVKEHGVLVPALVREKPDGGYEMIAGHRRKRAAELAELPEIPCIVRNLTDDEAIIVMVDSNLQREKILPSEKAFAYKMKLDAMRRVAGRPAKENSVPLGQNFGKTSREVLAENSPDSNTQIQRYTNADAGCGLIKYGSALVPFINRFPKNTKLYQLMTTKPGEGVFGGAVNGNANN